MKFCVENFHINLSHFHEILCRNFFTGICRIFIKFCTEILKKNLSSNRDFPDLVTAERYVEA